MKTGMNYISTWISSSYTYTIKNLYYRANKQICDYHWYHWWQKSLIWLLGNNNQRQESLQSLIPNSFQSIYRSFHIFNCRRLSAVENVNTTINWLETIRNKESKGSSMHYELTSPILYMEQYIPFSLIICEPLVEF